MRNSLFVAIDGGGSKSAVMVVSKDGNILYNFEAGPLNIVSIGKSRFIDNLARIKHHIRASFLLKDIEGYCLSLAGASRFKKKIYKLAASLLNNNVYIITDIEASFLAATKGEDGIIVSSGTGSFAYGKRGEDTARAGGWGYLVGDEGSAYWIGRETLRYIFMAHDGRKEKTELYYQILQNLNTNNIEEAIPTIYSRYKTPKKMARFSQITCKMAEKGDRIALEIIDEASEHLFNLVKAVSKRLFKETDNIVPVYGTGSVIKNCEILAQNLKQKIETRLPKHKFSICKTPDVVGAIIYYLQQTQTSMEIINKIETQIQTLFKQ